MFGHYVIYRRPCSTSSEMLRRKTGKGNRASTLSIPMFCFERSLCWFRLSHPRRNGTAQVGRTIGIPTPIVSTSPGTYHRLSGLKGRQDVPVDGLNKGSASSIALNGRGRGSMEYIPDVFAVRRLYITSHPVIMQTSNNGINDSQ